MWWKEILNKPWKKSLKVGLKKLLVIFFVIIAFFILAAFLIALLRLAQKGFSVHVFHEAMAFSKKILLNPLYLADVYVDWAQKSYKLWQRDKISEAQFIPMLFPILFLMFVIWKGYPFVKKIKESLKTVLFSNPQKLFEKNLHHGTFAVLGTYDDKLLKMPENSSLLALGNDSGGKTSSICIPTILSAHESSIVAVSSQNELAEFTSGYRATLGPVFYFNWGLTDVPVKNEYYMRWNPLSVKEMPPKGQERNDYLNGLSRYFIFHNDQTDVLSDSDDYWPKLASRALFGLLSFFVSKIERAAANDYFLGMLLEKDRLSQEDRRLLLSYYVIMEKEYAAPAIESLEQGTLTKDNYLPIGSWEGVPQAWQGKELCLSMFADWLLQCFLRVKSQEEKVADAWKVVLEYCMQESEFFGYGANISEILQQLFYLSHKQRSVIFPMLFNPLSIFRIPSVRERTSTSDFCISQLHSTYADKICTIYCVSGDKNVNFINKLFVDMLMYSSLMFRKQKNGRSLLWIFDNLEQQPEYQSLPQALEKAKDYNMGFVLTAGSLANMQLKYSFEAVESIINKTQYKVLLTDTLSAAANELQKMAHGGIVLSSVKNTQNQIRINDAAYFSKVAKRLSQWKKTKLLQGDEILFIPSFYRMPFKIKAAYFLASENLKKKATIDAAYFVDDALLQLRNVQDIETPELLKVLEDAGYKLNNLEEIDLYLENKYEEAVETIGQVSDKESVLVDDISTRWQNQKEVTDNNQDWWMDEEAFDFSEMKDNTNPFQKN